MQREAALDYFKNGSTKVLVASDAAARGLDVKDISCVVNFDFPKDIESYVHRIGRTGRGTTSGTSISYFTDQDESLSRSLVSVLKQASQEIPDFLQFIAPPPSSSSQRRPTNRGPNNFF